MRAIWAKLATFALSLGLALSGGCMADLEPADDGSATPLKVGETRTIELRYLRFDVSNFEQAPTAELQARDRPVKSSWTGSSRKLRLRDTHNPFKQLNLRAK